LNQLDVSTIFAPHEIQAIRKHLSGLLGQNENDPVVIPKDEFFRFLGTTSSSLYVNRLYTIFDLPGKGYVTFEDLINGLSVLNQKATREQKLMLSFHLLDPEGTGYITKKMTTDVLRSCLAEWRELEITLSEEQIARIVNSTFDEADLDRNGLIDLNEYQALDAKHPGLSDFLTVDALGVLNHLEKVHSMNTGITMAE
jgi:serine/threonine-protein phosphatase 2B regulatory subunit